MTTACEDVLAFRHVSSVRRQRKLVRRRHDNQSTPWSTNLLERLNEGSKKRSHVAGTLPKCRPQPL